MIKQRAWHGMAKRTRNNCITVNFNFCEDKLDILYKSKYTYRRSRVDLYSNYLITHNNNNKK